MQLEQQETFELKGPQLEVFGRMEDKLPPAAKKKPVALAVCAVMALVSVFGIGGAQMKGAYQKVLSVYTAADKYNHSIQGDFATQADAAANLIRLAGRTLGENDADVVAASDALQLWNDNTAPEADVQFKLNTKLYSAVDALYTAAAAGADSKTKGQLDDQHDAFVSAQDTIDRAAATYNDEAAAYNRKVSMFPANLIGPLWGTATVPPFA